MTQQDEVELNGLYSELQFQADLLLKTVAKWHNNPMHWTNNKRRMHGYCPLRGRANRKDRFDPPRSATYPFVREMCDLINRIIHIELKYSMDDMFSKLVSVSQFVELTHRYS